MRGQARAGGEAEFGFGGAQLADELDQPVDIGAGVGIARGFATMGRIGFEGRSDYAAIGTVSNLASRLSDEAKAGQILVSQRVAAVIEPIAATGFIGELPLKGFARKTPTYELLALRQVAAATG